MSTTKFPESFPLVIDQESIWCCCTLLSGSNATSLKGVPTFCDSTFSKVLKDISGIKNGGSLTSTIRTLSDAESVKDGIPSSVTCKASVYLVAASKLMVLAATATVS